MNRVAVLSMGILIALSGCAPGAGENPVAETSRRGDPRPRPHPSRRRTSSRPTSRRASRSTSRSRSRAGAATSRCRSRARTSSSSSSACTSSTSPAWARAGISPAWTWRVDGEVYDVDFFLEGDPGAMTVTETTVHKLNGQPFYVWEQNEDKHLAPRRRSTGASEEHLGVLKGTRRLRVPSTGPRCPRSRRQARCGFRCRRRTLSRRST